MMHKKILVALLLTLLLPLPARAAVTSIQLETLVTSTAGVPFRQRVEFAYVLTAEQVLSEAGATAKHAQRALLASQILQNPDGYVTQFSQAVVVQLPLSTTNLVTVNSVPNADVDTTDTAIQAAISAVWNGFTTAP